MVRKMTSIDEVIAALCQCMSCNHKFRIDYDPPISWEVFTVHRARKEFLCEKCNTPCQSIGQFNHVEQQEQDQVPDLEPPIPIQKMESMDEWRILVKEKYDKLEQVVKDNLPSLWLAIEFVLSIRSIMNIAGVTLPWFGIILGRASSLKTAAIEMLRDTINTFYTDIFTPKSFVSNSTAVSKDKLGDIDMLPKVKNKLFLVSELSSMFTKKEEEVQETLGIFTRLADGHGLQTNTGAHGSRGYRDVYFNMIGAAVDIPYKVYKLLGYLGPKLYFLRLKY